MVVQPEKPPVPHRRHVVCQVAVQEALVSQRDARLVEWHQLAFNPRDPLSERVAAARQDRLACLVVAEDLLHGRHLGEAVMEFGMMCLQRRCCCEWMSLCLFVGCIPRGAFKEDLVRPSPLGHSRLCSTG